MDSRNPILHLISTIMKMVGIFLPIVSIVSTITHAIISSFILMNSLFS
jgi:hypothetical protein